MKAIATIRNIPEQAAALANQYAAGNSESVRFVTVGGVPFSSITDWVGIETPAAGPKDVIDVSPISERHDGDPDWIDFRHDDGTVTWRSLRDDALLLVIP